MKNCGILATKPDSSTNYPPPMYCRGRIGICLFRNDRLYMVHHVCFGHQRSYLDLVKGKLGHWPLNLQSLRVQ